MPYSAHARNFITDCFTSRHIHGPVLEIGSGRDRFNRDLFSKRYKVVATNIYPKGVVDQICSVNSLPFKEGEFGCVICEHVLEHTEEPARAIEEMYRVLKPGGLLILVVPFSWPLHEKPYDLWRFSEEGIRALLMKRFEKAEFAAMGNSRKPALICAAARKPVRMKEIITPKVSVIMPSYNRASMLGASIESVLKQTFKDWELIIVSDGSTDNTPEVVSRYKDPRIRFFKQENNGSASARNCALRSARGHYIAYCDDDDMLLPYHLETLVRYLDRHPEAAMIKAVGVAVPLSGKTGFRTLGFLWALMHRKSVLKKVGFFDEKLRVSQDLDFIFRLIESYPPVFTLNSIIVRHVLHEKGIVHVRKKQLKYYEDIVYVKRVRRVFRRNKLDEKELLMVMYILHYRYPKAALALLRLSGILVDQEVDWVYLAGLIYYNAGHYKEAIKYFKRVLIFSGSCGREASRRRNRFKEFACILLGKTYFLKRSYVISLRYLLDAARFKASLLPKAELLRYYRKTRDVEQILMFRKRIKNNAILLYAKGSEFLCQKKYENAVNILARNKFLHRGPLCYLFCELLADIYLEKGNSALADEYQRFSLEYERKFFFSALLSESIFSIDKKRLKEIVANVLLPGAPEPTQLL